jgi:hypothetical protein
VTTHGTPPSRPLEALLPFDDSSRDDRWFENAVRDLMRLIGYENVEFYGGPGDPQEGIDIRATHQGRRVGVQAKKRETFPESEADAAIAAATYQADDYVLALARRATVGVQRAIDRTGGRWQLWDKVTLSEMVRQLDHDVAVRYIEQHFHPAHVETFLGRAQARTFIERERFFAPFLNPDGFIYHEWNRIDSAKTLAQFQDALAAHGVRVVVVSGRIGSGKSKLLHDATSGPWERQLYFVAPGASITPESLQELRSESAVVVVDDADDVGELPVLFGHALSRPTVTMVLSVSALGRRSLLESLLQLGFSSDAVVDVQLPRLGRADTVALVQQVLPGEHRELDDAVVRFASDTPLSTLLTARVIREQHVSASGVSSVQSVRALIRALYRDIAIGNVRSDMAPEDVRSVLELVAIMGPVRIQDDEWLAGAAAFLRWEQDRLLRVVDALDDSGIVVRHGHHYTIAPELLRQSIVLEACVAGGRATSFPGRVLQAFPFNVRVLRNIAIADVESHEDSGPEIFAPVWTTIVEQVRAAHSADRLEFFSKLKEVAYLKPVECLRLIREILDSPATNDDQQPFANVFIVDHNHVVRTFPDQLRAIAYTAPERTPEVVRLLWRLAPENMTWTHESPVATIRDLARFDPRVGLRVPELVVRAVREMIDAAEVDTERHSLIDLVSPALARDLTLSTSDHIRLLIQRTVVDVAATRSVRDAALALIGQAARGSDARRADAALKALGELLRDPMNLPREPTADERAAWDRESAAVFDVFEELVDRDSMALRGLRIRDTLWCLTPHAGSEFVRARATPLLERVERDPEVSRYRALAPEFRRFDSFVDVGARDAWLAADGLVAAFMENMARDYRQRCPDAISLLDEIAARMRTCEQAGVQATPQELFRYLTDHDPDFGPALMSAIMSRGDEIFLRFVDALLMPMFLRSPALAVELANRLLETGSAAAAIAVAHAAAVRGDGEDTSAADRERLLTTVLRDSRADVKRAATHPYHFFANRYPESAARIIMASDVGCDAQLADELLSGLPHDLSALDDATVTALLGKLRDVNDLRHWASDVLQRLIPQRTVMVVEFLVWRLRLAPDRHDYHPIPYVDISFSRMLDELVQAPQFEEAFARLVECYSSSPPRSRYFFDLLMGQLARGAPARLKTAITAALASSDAELHRTGVSWLRNLPHEVVTNDLDFVVCTVERSCEIDLEFGRTVTAALVNAIGFGAEAVAMYEAAPRDIRIQNVARGALAREVSPDARELFEQLLACGERSAQESILYAEDTFGPQ